MGIIAKESSGSKYPPIEEGVYVATVYSLVDLGVQRSEKFKNESHKIMITWEIPELTIDVDGEEKPRVVSKEYTLSLSEKSNLRKDLESFRNKKFNDEELKGFALNKVLGKSCQIQIITNEKGYSNIGAIMSLPKGVKSTPPVNDIIEFDLESENSIPEMANLPEWIQTKIKNSETYKAMCSEPKEVDLTPYLVGSEEELPF